MKAKTFIKMLIAIIIVNLSAGLLFAAEKPLMRVNPFELPKGIYSKENIPKKTPQTLALEAIFTIQGEKIATISGQNFVKGDFGTDIQKPSRLG